VRSATGRRLGFTLAEVVVVMLILGLTAAVVAPAMRSTPYDRLATAADELVRVLERARRSAAELASPVRLTLDPRSGRVRMEAIDGDTVIGIEDRALSLGPARLELDLADRALTFDPLGGATPGSLRLRFGSAVQVIAVERWTGAARRTAAR
jgi:type II secretion system protein H